MTFMNNNGQGNLRLDAQGYADYLKQAAVDVAALWTLSASDLSLCVFAGAGSSCLALMRRYREEEPLLNKDKMKTMAFSNLVGSIIFLAIGIWAWFQTDNFPEVANTYVQASTFPRVMIVGMLIFSVVLLIQSIFKLMGTMKPTDPVAVEVGTLNPLKDGGVAGGGRSCSSVCCSLLCSRAAATSPVRCGALDDHHVPHRQAQLGADGLCERSGAAADVAGVLQGAYRQYSAGSAELPAHPRGHDIRREHSYGF